MERKREEIRREAGVEMGARRGRQEQGIEYEDRFSIGGAEENDWEEGGGAGVGVTEGGEGVWRRNEEFEEGELGSTGRGRTSPERYVEGSILTKGDKEKGEKRGYKMLEEASPGFQGGEPEVTVGGGQGGGGIKIKFSGHCDVEAEGGHGGLTDDDTDDEDVEAMIREASKSYWRMFTVTIMGTLDDMLVFIALVSGTGNEESSKSINALSLLVGSTAAAGCVVGASLGLSRVRCFRRGMKKVPMWGLLAGISVYVLIIGMIE